MICRADIMILVACSQTFMCPVCPLLTMLLPKATMWRWWAPLWRLPIPRGNSSQA